MQLLGVCRWYSKSRQSLKIMREDNPKTSLNSCYSFSEFKAIVTRVNELVHRNVSSPRTVHILPLWTGRPWFPNTRCGASAARRTCNRVSCVLQAGKQLVRGSSVCFQKLTWPYLTPPLREASRAQGRGSGDSRLRGRPAQMPGRCVCLTYGKCCYNYW